MASRDWTPPAPTDGLGEIRRSLPRSQEDPSRDLGEFRPVSWLIPLVPAFAWLGVRAVRQLHGMSRWHLLYALCIVVVAVGYFNVMEIRRIITLLSG